MVPRIQGSSRRLPAQDGGVLDIEQTLIMDSGPYWLAVCAGQVRKRARPRAPPFGLRRSCPRWLRLGIAVDAVRRSRRRYTCQQADTILRPEPDPSSAGLVRYPGRTPVSQGVAFQWLQAVLARRGACEQARIVAIRNEKVRGFESPQLHH